MSKQKSKKFESAFSYEDLSKALSGLTAQAAHSFTKRQNLSHFENLQKLLPDTYVTKLQGNIESIDLIYSGTTESPLLLTMLIGRNDVFKNQEKFDVDVFNIAPDTSAGETYFREQWHHFKDENGNRVSYDIHPFKTSDEETKKDITYSVFLTGSTSYYNFAEYQKEKPDFFKFHNQSFGLLNNKAAKDKPPIIE